mgnify:CR=1 FL=1
MDNRCRIRKITECGLLMATALALSLIKLYTMPTGGSVSLGILPLLLIASRHGMKTGIFCGFAFGFLLLGNGATVVHPVQFLLDYPLAYACTGLAGAVKWNNFLKAATATTVANLIRLQFHVVAGAVFFSETKENFSEALAFSYAYNCGHLIPETIICAAIVWFIASKHQNLCSQQELI